MAQYQVYVDVASGVTGEMERHLIKDFVIDGSEASARSRTAALMKSEGNLYTYELLPDPNAPVKFP